MTSEAPMKNAELEKRILRLHKGGTGLLKIGKTLGIGTGTVQRVLMEQSRPFDVHVAEAAFEPTERLKAAIDAMRTHSRDFEERIRTTKREEQKDPLEMSDQRAPRRLRALAGRLLRQFRKRGSNGEEGGFVPGIFAEIK
jgi:hypothetical protein